MRFLPPPANRPYVRGSIMSLCVVLGVTVSGFSRLLFPGVVSTSSALQALPAAVLLYLNLSWIGSGIVTALGIWSGRRRLEVLGLILISGSFSAYFVAILAFKTDGVFSVLYIFGFAVGAGLRALYLVGGRGELVVVDKDGIHSGVARRD